MNLFDIIEDPPIKSDWKPAEPPILTGIKEIELDFETTGLRWWAGDKPIGVAIRTPDGVCRYLPWGHTNGNLDEDVIRRWFKEQIRHKHITNLNTRFDLHMARAWGIDLEEQGCTVADVGHYAALLDDHRVKFSLETISQDYLGQGKVTTVAGQKIDATRMASYPAQVIAPYAEQDVRLVGELKSVMLPKLRDEEPDDVRRLEESLIFAVVEMERNGAPVDLEKLTRWVSESEKDYVRCISEIYEHTKLRVNPDSSDDLKKLFIHLGLEFTAFTETGRPSFTDAVLKEIRHPVIELVRRAGKLADLRSKYLCKYANSIGSDGILSSAGRWKPSGVLTSS